ncbi:hypothetical protein FRB94_008728 [Tulasnella sp. JGI-2019a]|nr:hypothetical protein FRB93_006882 [Tulasnella sp. JGI-2019a]KAG8995840.1 hypothetical protein FRB94_008728 [Tulasnella sp. JGI-2019a]KAG9036048.1 hypothetical protein FRB95_010048 [Tulasnella sp. JGI-2019a]
MDPEATSSGFGKDQLQFFHVLERLKTQKRTGWVENKIVNAESISDHMHRMALLALCVTDKSVDKERCALLATVHDIAEAQVGDIAPSHGISKMEKHRMETDAMHNFVVKMLHSGPAGLRIQELWQEYEDQVTPEARLVKDLDLFEMALQAMEYEKGSPNGMRLDNFFETSIPRIKHLEVQGWAGELLKERAEFWSTVFADTSV